MSRSRSSGTFVVGPHETSGIPPARPGASVSALPAQGEFAFPSVSVSELKPPPLPDVTLKPSGWQEFLWWLTSSRPPFMVDHPSVSELHEEMYSAGHEAAGQSALTPSFARPSSFPAGTSSRPPAKPGELERQYQEFLKSGGQGRK